MRRLVIALWGNAVQFLLPWRLRAAVWNWMWNLPKERRVDWRSTKKVTPKEYGL